MSFWNGAEHTADPEYGAYIKARFSYWAMHPEKSPDKVHPEEASRKSQARDLIHPESTRMRHARHNAKRDRALGFVPLNSSFAGSEAHHINAQDVIYIPKEMHRSIYHNQFSGQGMADINALAGQYLTEDWT